jgi:hypothetical protein
VADPHELKNASAGVAKGTVRQYLAGLLIGLAEAGEDLVEVVVGEFACRAPLETGVAEAGFAIESLDGKARRTWLGA